MDSGDFLQPGLGSRLQCFLIIYGTRRFTDTTGYIDSRTFTQGKASRIECFIRYFTVFSSPHLHSQCLQSREYAVVGKLGFARDGYLNTFNYQFYPDEMASIAISGDEKSTRLYVNGQLKEDLNIQKRFFNGGKDSMSYVRTLVFPLEKAGNFKSTITNLEVLNYCK